MTKKKPAARTAREHRIQVKLNDVERERLEAAAERRGLELGAFFRFAGLELALRDEREETR